MKTTLAPLASLSLACCTALACDPTPAFDPSRAARPDRAAATDRAERPAITAGAYSSACDPDAYTCVGTDALEYCGTRGWETTSCAAVCASAGMSVSLGCGFDDWLGGDACFCDYVETAPSATCAEGWSCSGATTLSYCAEGYEEVWSCDAVCRDAGYAAASACDYDEWDEATCYCDDLPDQAGTTSGCRYGEESCGDGTCVDAAWVCDGYDDCATGYDEWGCAACNFGGGVCNGGDAVDTCEGGVVSTWSCDDLCRQSGFDYSEGCAYDSAAGTDTCFCNDVWTCAPDELTCGDGSCVSQDYICDGYQDCAGADDELGCVAECVPGDSYCTGAYTIEYCDDAGFWTAWDCDEVCQQSGYDYADSCGYDAYAGADSCWCN